MHSNATNIYMIFKYYEFKAQVQISNTYLKKKKNVSVWKPFENCNSINWKPRRTTLMIFLFKCQFINGNNDAENQLMIQMCWSMKTPGNLYDFISKSKHKSRWNR